MTQWELAEAADVDRRHLQTIERAGANPTIAVVAAIAEALGVPPSRLLRPAKLQPPRRGRPKKSNRIDVLAPREKIDACVAFS